MHSIYFLGGSPGSGKTTFTDTLHKNAGVAVYHTDDILLSSVAAKDKQPHMFALRELSDPLDIWDRSPQGCLDFWLKYYEEAFDILVEDLPQRQDVSQPLVAEGVCILPYFLERFHDRPNACFLVSGHAFLKEAISKKLKQIPAFSEGIKGNSKYRNMLYVFSSMSEIVIEGCKRNNFPYLIMQNSEDYPLIYSKILHQFPSLRRLSDGSCSG